jgi:hypothetical protein
MEHVKVLGMLKILAVQMEHRGLHLQKNDVCLHWQEGLPRLANWRKAEGAD